MHDSSPIKRNFRNLTHRADKNLKLPLIFDLQDFLLRRQVFSVPLVRLYIEKFTDQRKRVRMHGQSSGLPMQTKFLVQVFAVKEEDRGQYRSVIFPADRALEGALVCEKWHKDEFEVVQILQQISHGTVDITEVPGQAQSVEGWLGELPLTDSEAVLLGWRPELLGD